MLSSSIKDVKVTYDPINEENTFTSGDVVSGRVTLEIEEAVEVKSFFVRAKGKARVCWTERHGQVTVVYKDKEKYFVLEEHYIHEGRDTVIPPGTHVYPFTFRIPQENMPPSVKCSRGGVVYSLEAKLSRSMRLPSTGKAEFQYKPRAVMTSPDLMVPQYGSKEKKMKFFTSGKAFFTVSTERIGYHLGEAVKVMSEVNNGSSRQLTLKYALYSKHSFIAKTTRRVSTNTILKEEGEPIDPSASRVVTKVINIPPDIPVSILDCRVLKVEYRLKVYLDVPYASDPEIKLPLVILPISSDPEGKPPPYNEEVQAGWNSFANSAPPPYNSYGMFPSLSDFGGKY